MASTRLTRTQSSDTTNYNFTFSFWMKQSSVTTASIFSTQTGNDEFRVEFDSNGSLFWYKYNGSSFQWNLYTERRFTDPNAWYHFVLQYDSTQATASNRLKMYVNGVQETVFKSGYENYPSQNENSFAFQGGTAYIGCNENQNAHFDGILSHINMVHGSTPAYTSFGSTDSTTGEWKINTSPSVTYGSQGYFILKDGSSVTDQSGNSNNWTVANGTLSNTEDCPSNVFATLNPLTANCTLSNGNNTWVATQSGYEHSSATLGASSGKYYWEVKPNGACGAMGITDFNWQFERRGSLIYASSGYSWVYEGNGYVSHNSYGDIASNYSTYTSSDIIGVALDLDNNKLYFHKNGTYENSGDPTSGSTGTGAISIDAPSSLPSGFYSPLVADLCSASVGGGDVNFGNGYFGTTAISSEGTNASGIGKFEYDVPTGYTALSTKGLNE